MMVDRIQRFQAKLIASSAGNRKADAKLKIQCEAVAEDFDSAFYATRYPEISGDLLDHFMRIGWREGRDPTPWFSTSFYLETYPDVADAGLNPFYHYLRHGRAEKRLIAPAKPQADSRLWEIESIREVIDQAFYAEQLRSVGIDPVHVDLSLHYWREGAKLGLDPAPDFSTTYYLSAHSDVAASGVNPFAHYLAQGKNEGRSVRDGGISAPPQDIQKTNSDDRPLRSDRRTLRNDDRDLLSSAFDADYYVSANPDVAAANVDPLDHFMTTGWREGRNPTLWFSVSHYLDFYPDVAEAGINPFLHYLLAGKSEGRTPRHDLGFRYDIIASLEPLERRISSARRSAPRRQPTNAKSLRDALQQAKRVESKGLYVSVSHDDFTENFGGVQLVLMRESAAVEGMGYDHLHLFPNVPLQVVELETDDPVVGVLLNRQRIGYFRASEIRQELYIAAPRMRSVPFVVHSLIGHNAEALVSLLKAAGCRSGWYWVHDYSSVCAGYTLLRNDVEFCGGPSPTSTACSICVYGGLRMAQIKAHQLLFDEFNLTVLAPSESALDIWKASASAVAPAVVHEHLRLRGSASPNQTALKRAPRTLRVAYIGQPVTHKGWPVFRDLTLRFGDDRRYQFYHVGKGPQGVPATFVEVAVGADDLDKMVRTLRKLKIDVALVWSLWPETFCIAAVEALRAGAAILTFKDSGNVAAIVQKTGLGSVLDSEADLIALFESGEVMKLAVEARPTGLTAEFSNMTVDFIPENEA